MDTSPLSRMSFDLEFSFDFTQSPQPPEFTETLLDVARPLLSALAATYKATFDANDLECLPVFHGLKPPPAIDEFELEVTIHNISMEDVRKLTAELIFQVGRKLQKRNILLTDAFARILIPNDYTYSEDPRNNMSLN